MSKRTYKIPIEWKCYGTILVDAESLEEAMEESKYESLPMGNYLDDSAKYDWSSINEQYPNEWKNEKLVTEYKEYVRDFMEKTKPMINCLLPATYDQWRACELLELQTTTNRIEDIMED
jgi:hypothetical protein